MDAGNGNRQARKKCNANGHDQNEKQNAAQNRSSRDWKSSLPEKARCAIAETPENELQREKDARRGQKQVECANKRFQIRRIRANEDMHEEDDTGEDAASKAGCLNSIVSARFRFRWLLRRAAGLCGFSDLRDNPAFRGAGFPRWWKSPAQFRSPRAPHEYICPARRQSVACLRCCHRAWHRAKTCLRFRPFRRTRGSALWISISRSRRCVRHRPYG